MTCSLKNVYYSFYGHINPFQTKVRIGHFNSYPDFGWNGAIEAILSEHVVSYGAKTCGGLNHKIICNSSLLCEKDCVLCLVVLELTVTLARFESKISMLYEVQKFISSHD